jgi:phosphoglycolate phosphatase-like HAD superfamily hydrolase
MVGDDMRDVRAGISAGCIPVFLTANGPCKDTENIKIFANLQGFIEQFLLQENL